METAVLGGANVAVCITDDVHLVGFQFGFEFLFSAFNGGLEHFFAGLSVFAVAPHGKVRP